MSKIRFLFQRPFVVIFIFVLATVTEVVTESAMACDDILYRSSLCDSAIRAPREGTLRSFAASGESLIRLDLDTAGIVTVEVARASYQGGRAGLGIPQGETELTLIERSATHVAFAVREAGVWFLRVASEDPRRPLLSYKLTTSFVEAEIRQESFDLDAGLHAVQTDFYASGTELKHEDHEVDPDPFLAQGESGSLLVRLVRFSTASGWKHEDHEVDPDPLGWDSEAGRTLARVVLFPAGSVFKHEDHEVDPDPLHGAGGQSGSITALVTFPAVDAVKHEDHEVDPDPFQGDAVAAAATGVGGLLLRFSTSDDALTGTDAFAPESRVAWLRWLAGWIFSDAVPARDERFRLLAYTSASEASMLRLRPDERCAHL